MSEDIDLVLRLKNMGARFYFQPGAIVHQFYNKSARQLVDDAIWSGRNPIILSRKQPEYRPHCVYAKMGRSGGPKRLVRWLCADCHFTPTAA